VVLVADAVDDGRGGDADRVERARRRGGWDVPLAAGWFRRLREEFGF
jgi:hypothetical protein